MTDPGEPAVVGTLSMPRIGEIGSGRGARRRASSAPQDFTARRRLPGPRQVGSRPPIDRIFGGRPLPTRLRGAVIALGNFDGFHRGHQAVAARALELARSRGVAAIVATFDPHPKRLFKPGATPFRLTSLDQRQRYLADYGIDAMMVFEFTPALANVTPEEFVSHRLRDASGVVTGENFAFGRGRAGDVDLLARLGAERGLTLDPIGSVGEAGDAISSTRIRAALQQGDCAAAARLLTRPYTIAGELRPGVRMDPGLPLLDASIRLGDYLRPRRGVYAVRAHLPDARVLGGSAYLESAGDGGPEQLLELFLIDVQERDLGKPVSVELIAHLHDAPEIRDAPELRKRIAIDRDQAREIVASPAVVEAGR